MCAIYNNTIDKGTDMESWVDKVERDCFNTK